jgi:hypothetical protein
VILRVDDGPTRRHLTDLRSTYGGRYRIIGALLGRSCVGHVRD